jgi:pimeloyl-ACP methyl ester carboxylesterase
VKLAARAVLVIAAAGAASAAYQQIEDVRDRRRFPPPGRLVDVGDGRRMHILAEGGGDPAVIIIPALADSVLGWVRTARAAARAAGTTVCVYDRAGIGWSDRRARATFDAVADNLHALVDAAGIRKPYIVAGHSIGGIIARRLQARYPDDVAGMLLIDSSHEQQARRLGWRYGYRPHLVRVVQRRSRVLGARRLAANFGLVAGMDDASYERETIPDYVAAARAIDLSSAQRRTVIREILMFIRPQHPPQPLGALPLTVITALAQMEPGFRAMWQQMQDELAALSSDSVHVQAVNAGHYVHLDEPDLITQAIRDLVKRCR